MSNQGKRKTAVFMLAHYDDEFGVFDLLRHHSKLGDRVIVVYLTSSAKQGRVAKYREKLSRAILMRLSKVDPRDILCLGRDLLIPDLRLTDHLEIVLTALNDQIRERDEIDCMYTLAFEGGHPDHDATFVH